MDMLLQDPWLVAAFAGFLLSLIALPFTLHKYREAVSAGLPEIPNKLSPLFDDDEDEKTQPSGAAASTQRLPAPGKFLDARDVLAGPPPSRPPTSPVKPPVSRPPTSVVRPGTGVLRPQTGAVPAPAPSAKAEPPAASGTGSLKAAAATNQAVAYLQNLKSQMDVFQKEILELRGQVQATSQKQEKQFSSLIEKLTALQKEMRQSGPAASTGAPSAYAEDIPLPEPPAPNRDPDSRTGRVELDILPTSALLGKRQAKGRRSTFPAPSAEIPKAVVKSEEAPPASLEPIEEESPAPAAARKPRDRGLDISLSIPEESAPPDEGAAAATGEEAGQGESAYAASQESEAPAEEAPPEEAQVGEARAESAGEDDSQPIPDKSSPASADDDILRPSGKGPVWPV